ncbi:MAG: thioredoxin-dependent thiol peroxidase [Candidatus Electryonea clarkiae]|nr:thioredoxin-dependent thiol peroxidase [Candidatus Electryonea clarkiae]MDP8287656.1 thioredoxin-dependent thiol peroxidase [Candidatus Electryonea clarkiae]
MPNVSDKAPDFRLLNQRDDTVSLKDFKGKWVVLYFYPKDNTSGCTIEAKEFTGCRPDIEGMNAVILGVSPDSIKSHNRFIEKQELGIDLLSDPDHEALEAYGAWGLKKMAGREYMGVFRSTFIIDPDGKIAAQWLKVRVKGHVDAVRAKLSELQR